MCNQTIKIIGLSLVIITFISCGQSSNDNSLNSTENSTVPKVEPVITVLDLNRNLSTTVAESEIISTSIEGLDYSIVNTNDVKNIWKSNSFVTALTNIRYVAPRCKDTASESAICGRSTNTGLTSESPWDFYGVAKNDYDIPFDTIVWMKSGHYSNPLDDNKDPLDDSTPMEVTLSGEYNKPIHFRPEQGQFTGANGGVQIDGGLKITGEWIWIWELEMTPLEKKEVQVSTDVFEYDLFEWRPITSPLEYYFDSTGYDAVHHAAPTRAETGLYAGDSSKIINSIVHGTGQGISSWKPVSNFEVHGSIVYDNGITDQARAHGHGMYIQNNSGTERLISDNLFGGNMGEAIQAWGSSASYVKDISIIGNVVFATRRNTLGGVIIGYDTSPNMKFNDNFMAGGGLQFPYVIYEEYLNNPNPEAYNREAKNNVLYDAARGIDFDSSNTQIMSREYSTAQSRSVIRPNKYDPRRGNLMVFNPERKDVISVDLADFAKEGDRIVVFNPFRLHEPLEYGKYNGRNLTITWPESDWPVVSYSDQETENPAKEFWAFVLINHGK